jgi:predicted amidophosphoribosyltransferase
MPCPDCGSPVQPEREQLCPKCGYPLMFLRQGGGHDAEAQAVPRRPNERDDPTSLRAVPQAVPQPRTSSFAPATYGAPPGQVQCRTCGYPNEPARFRCERCGGELRQSRPYARTLAPPAPAAAPKRAGGWGWLIALIVLAVLAVLALAATLVWRFIG